VAQKFSASYNDHLLILLAIVLPCFISGLADDIIKNTTPYFRLGLTIISSFLAIHFLRISPLFSSSPYINLIIELTPAISIIAVIIFIVSITNAFNLIDGLNGLSSVTGIISLCGIGYLSFKYGNSLCLVLSVICCFSILGFIVFNFPGGLLFLGDCGAYFIGFLTSVNCLLLNKSNPEISLFTYTLILAYPISEIFFSVFRKIISGTSPVTADTYHLHTLLFKNHNSLENYRFIKRISIGISPYFWISSLLFITPAILFPQNDVLLFSFFCFYFSIYCIIYYIARREFNKNFSEVISN